MVVEREIYILHNNQRLNISEKYTHCITFPFLKCVNIREAMYRLSVPEIDSYIGDSRLSTRLSARLCKINSNA